MAADPEHPDDEFLRAIPDWYAIPDVVPGNAKRHGDRIAVRFVDEDDTVAERT